MPLDAVLVRPMVAADAGEVLTVQRAAFVVEAQLYGDPFLPPLVETVAQVVADLGRCRGLVAIAGDRLVGSVRVRVDGSTLHIGRLAVAPDQQGRGLGALLLARAEEVAPATEALLFTGHRSDSNLRLYERAGYTEQRRVPFDDRVTLVHLRKPLG
ncbi:MAG: GNAT family N-acetyltransferase [Propionibacteriaceae bacterium]|nr:GNAT family N-acetyltransferase [Propionibacteriaceae bacterium]